MAASAISSSSICTSPFLASPRGRCTRKYGILRSTTRTFAMGRSEADHDHHDYQGYSGRNIVDENMTVLRKRIHELKIIERNYEPPSEWMDWEKSYYTSYDSMICDAVGILQLLLMNTRPSLAIGMIALVSLSVPTSLFVVISQLMGLTNGVLGGFHLS